MYYLQETDCFFLLRRLFLAGRPDSIDWKLREIDSIWHNQTGDWSQNATKHSCADIDEDGKSEVFISLSERAGYPVAYYKLIDAEINHWEKHIIIDELPAAHTLQVAVLDNDGDLVF